MLYQLQSFSIKHMKKSIQSTDSDLQILISAINSSILDPTSISMYNADVEILVNGPYSECCMEIIARGCGRGSIQHSCCALVLYPTETTPECNNFLAARAYTDH